MRSVSEGGWLSGLSGSFRNNKPFVMVALVVSLISIGCFLQTERTDYVKNDQGWQYPIYHRRWQTTLSDTTQKVKIVLSSPEKLDIWQKGSVVTRDFNENEYDRVRLEFWASGKSTGAYSLSVNLNGREAKRYSQGLRGNARWHSIPLEGPMREAIRDVGEAEVVFSLSGAPSPETDYVTFYGDAAVASQNSCLFDGADWTRDDLSEQPGVQQGEFYVRLAYTKGLFTDPSLTSERVVILSLYLVAICLLVLFRRNVNDFRISTLFSALKSTFKVHRELVVLLASVFVLALVLRSCFVTCYPQPELIKDAALYDTQARNAVSGYGLAAKPPQLYPMFFGYTLLLAGVYSVLGHNLQAVHLLQAVLGSLTCVLVFLIAYRSFDKDKHLSLVAGLLACCFPPFIEYTGRLLTETLATFALALFVYLFVAATRADRNQLFILSGLAFGLAVVSRDLFFYFLVFILAILVVTFWRNKGQVIRFTVLFLLGVILICYPLLARNALVFSPGRAFGTMVRLSFPQILVLAADQNTAPAESKVAEDNPEKGQETGPVGTKDALPTEASSVKNDLIRGWVRYLWGYVERWSSKIDEFWYSAANWRDAAIFGIPLKYLLVFRRLIVFMAMLGFIVSLPRWKEHSLLYSLIVYPSVVHAIFLPFPRYTIPWMPYVCIFAVRGIATIILVFRSGGKYVALSLIAWATAFAMTMNVDKQSLLKLFGPLITYAQLSVIRPYRLVIELCLMALICFLLINNRKKIPNALISTSAILLALGYVSLRGQTVPLSPYKEDVSSVLTDVDHYVGHLIDLPRWTQGYDRYFLKIKLDGAWIEPPQKKYGVRVFANGEMIKEYPINHEVIHGWERIPIDKRFIEGQKKLYVSLQVFGAPDVFENYLAVFIRQGKYYGISVFNDSTRYLSIDRDEKQNGTFLIGLEMTGKGPYRDVDLWLGSQLSQADKLSLLGDESRVCYNLGERIRLIGYEVSGTARSGEALRPRLYWQAQAPIDENYTVFVQLFDERGDLRAQHDCQPQRGDYPTSVWQRGEVIWDVHGIALPSDLPADTYRLVAGMYLPESMERLPVFDGTGRRLPDNLIPLGEIQVVGF
jgi:4-amino-4-deoxy-L-arabinose transferase-like glycosyltransferase